EVDIHPMSGECLPDLLEGRCRGRVTVGACSRRDHVVVANIDVGHVGVGVGQWYVDRGPVVQSVAVHVDVVVALPCIGEAVTVGVLPRRTPLVGERTEGDGARTLVDATTTGSGGARRVDPADVGACARGPVRLGRVRTGPRGRVAASGRMASVA